jgi:environmental stress-induced protein Ves
VRLIRVDEVAPTPWKNGGGVTRELLRLGAADDWTLRISVADIAADGPFSAFPGIRRYFAVIDGAGVRLRWADGRVLELTQRSGVISFDGADAPECELIDGPTRDLNVMVRQGGPEFEIGALYMRGYPVGSSEGPSGLFTARPVALMGRAGEWSDGALPAMSLLWAEQREMSLSHIEPTDADERGLDNPAGDLCTPLIFPIMQKPFPPRRSPAR